MNDLSHEIESKGGDGFELRKPYEHLRRLRIPKTSETRIQPNTKYLELVAYHLGLTGAKTRPNIGKLTHRTTMDAQLYRPCVGALTYYVLDRVDAQLVSKHFWIVYESPNHCGDESVAEVECSMRTSSCESRVLIQSQWS